jgi:hypothetical protein
MIHAEENVNVVPQCQHCEKDITMVWYQELSGFLGKRYITPQRILDGMKVVWSFHEPKGEKIGSSK